MDWLILVEPDGDALSEEILINVEFQTAPVDGLKIRAIADYCDFGKFYYDKSVCSVVVIGEGLEFSKREYRRVVSDILKPHTFI